MQTVNKERNLNLTKTSLIAALYIAITLMFAPFSFGAIQIRVSEMFNHLAVFNKRYVYAVTLGVAIANMFSPLGVIDVVAGTSQTFIMLLLVNKFAHRVKSDMLRIVLVSLFVSLTMFAIALVLCHVYNLNFWITYFYVAAGEFISMMLGGFVIFAVSKRINLVK